MFSFVQLDEYTLGYNISSSVGTPGVINGYKNRFDQRSGKRFKFAYPYTLQISGTLKSSTTSETIAQINNFRSLIGKRTTIVRENVSTDTAGRYFIALCTVVDFKNILRPQMINHSTYSLELLIESNWYGRAYTDWGTHTGYSNLIGSSLFPGSPANLSGSFTANEVDLVYTNIGTTRCLDPVFKVTIGGSDDTDYVRFEQSPQVVCHLTQALETGDVYIIDFGSQIATLNGTQVPIVETFGVNHTIEEWIEITNASTGTNTMTVLGTNLGASSDVQLSFVEQFI